MPVVVKRAPMVMAGDLPTYRDDDGTYSYWAPEPGEADDLGGHLVLVKQFDDGGIAAIISPLLVEYDVDRS